jgi:hypothetical protein
MAINPKAALPHTRTQKGKGWATLTLLACATFSLWANVRSGQLYRDSIVVSVMPPIVAFCTTKLIAYFSPRTKWTKALIYGGFGLITVVAMYGSGWHIVEYVHSTGQPWATAVSYVFITDAPMLLAAGVLVQKVPMTQSRTEPAKVVQPPQAPPQPPAKKTAPAKRTTPAKATKATKAAKPTVPSFKAPIPSITDDALEKEMLNA